MTQRVMPRCVSGDVVSGIRDRLANLISQNDGKCQFSILTNNAFNTDVPFNADEETHIRITNEFQDITQLDQTYLVIDLEADVKMTTANDKITLVDYVSTNKDKVKYDSRDMLTPYGFFVGWKNSAECIRQLQVESRDQFIGLSDKEVSRTSFLYNTFLPHNDLVNQKYAHTSYSQVQELDDSVCGGYYTIYPHQIYHFDDTAANEDAVTTFPAGITGETKLDKPDPGDTNKDRKHYTVTLDTTQTITIPLHIIVPITNILQFQCFQDWINAYGDITLKFYFNRESLVYCQLDPYKMQKKYHREQGFLTTENIRKFEDINITRTFTQINQTCPNWLVNCEKTAEENTVQAATLSITNMRCTRLQCDCYGYNVKDDCLGALRDMFTDGNPLIIPAQHLDIRTFTITAPSNGHYSADIPYILHNVTDCAIVFPENSTNTTCFKNPMVKRLQLIVNNIMYPNQPYESTYDYRFYISQIQAADFDSYIQPKEDYVHSLTHVREKALLKDVEYPPFDITSFFAFIQLERNSSGFFYDGLSTENLSIPVNLQFDSSPFAQSSIPPQVWIVKDTYWTLDMEHGLIYHEDEAMPE